MSFVAFNEFSLQFGESEPDQEEEIGCSGTVGTGENQYQEYVSQRFIYEHGA
jgi:hypothetical protein